MEFTEAKRKFLEYGWRIYCADDDYGFNVVRDGFKVEFRAAMPGWVDGVGPDRLFLELNVAALTTALENSAEALDAYLAEAMHTCHYCGAEHINVYVLKSYYRACQKCVARRAKRLRQPSRKPRKEYM